MKLKSKLIATIVSICAAIAVMGVGVWAATTSFDVAVSNTISFSFTHLNGTIAVRTATGADEKSQSTFTELDTTLYDGTNETAQINAIGPTEGTGTLGYEGARFFTNDYITAETTNAFVQYTFVYTPNEYAKAENGVVISIAEHTNPSPVSLPGGTEEPFTVHYLIGVSEGASYTAPTYYYNMLTDEGAARRFSVSATSYVTVIAVCEYANEGVSVDIEDNWNFKLNMSAIEAGFNTGNNVSNTLTPVTFAYETNADSTNKGVVINTQTGVSYTPNMYLYS